MRPSRRPTRWLSGWLIVVLLFAQLATAAYACPLPPAAAPSAPMAAMPGCDEHLPGALDPDQPQLCRAHCQQGAQTVGQPVAPDLTAVPVLLAVLDWTPAVVAVSPGAVPTAELVSGAPPPGSPPLYLSLLVLRN